MGWEWDLGMGWDLGLGWDYDKWNGMGWDGMGWDGMGFNMGGKYRYKSEALQYEEGGVEVFGDKL